MVGDTNTVVPGKVAGSYRHPDIEYGHIFSPHADDFPPWHDDQPSVACVAYLRFPDDDEFVYALHTTPLPQAAESQDKPQFHINRLEAAYPRGQWRDELSAGGRYYLSRLTPGRKRGVTQHHLQLLTASVRWIPAQQRFALSAQGAMLNIPDFVPWLAARCNLAEGTYDVFAECDEAEILSADAEADFADRKIVRGHQYGRDASASRMVARQGLNSCSNSNPIGTVAQTRDTLSAAPACELIKRKDLNAWLKRQVDALFD